MGVQEFRLPDVGEGLTEAEIVTWRVAPGDRVEVNDPIVEIETAKSLVELPSPYEGVVERLLVAAGETVPVGTPIIAVAVAGADGEPEPEVHDRRELHDRGEGVGQRESVLVGYGPRGGKVRSRRPPNPPSIMQSGTITPVPPAGKVLAKPPVRKLAKDLGVDLTAVTPTGAGGIVTRADVEAATRAAAEPVAPAPMREAEETRIPIRGVRRATAKAMVASAFTAPHVTLWLTVDVTRSVKFLRRLKQDPEFEGTTVSPLLLAARAVVLAAGRHPGVNARWDEAAAEIVQPAHVHLGIAVAAERGLLVPSLKYADRMSLRELAGGLRTLVTTAREGRATPADLSGGTLTITNIGVFGVDGGTPILNPGESAILGLGQLRQRPWVHRGTVKPRWVTELVLSVDHRVVDGELGGRFLADVGAVLERPDRLATWS
jgi:2-oxoisovalerate dehydrogenase E2 component (dihydrolipoyl transacylase)